jgi:hypothetical protein
MGCGASTSSAPPSGGPDPDRKVPLTAERHQMLKDVFHAMDFDKDGFIECHEFTERAKTLAPNDQTSLESMFYFFDDRGAQHRQHRNDGKLSQDEWISGIRSVAKARKLTDEAFDKEMKAILNHCATLSSVQTQATPAA